MASFYYYDQNPSGFSFLVQIIHFCYFNLAGITKFKCEWKNEEDSVCSSKMMPLCKINGLLFQDFDFWPLK